MPRARAPRLRVPGATTASDRPARATSCEQVELQHVPEGGDAVLPADLLPLRVRAARVRDGDLVNAGARLGETRGDLRLEPEAIAAQFGLDRAREISTDGFVARLHVREVQVG